MSKSIRLTDGTLLEPKINFLTIKLFQEEGLDKLYKKMQKMPNDSALQAEILSKFIYAIVRSTGRKVDEEEALMLIQMESDEDIETVMSVISDFEKRLENFKKKPASSGAKRKKK